MSRLLGVAGALVLLAGCGSTPARPVTSGPLPGAQVARMAERQLEAEDPRLAPGQLQCPDLVLTLGSEVRCERLATLVDGRMIRVPGTVRVTSLRGGGTLHVRLDDRAIDWGIDGAALARRVGALWVRRHRSADPVRCPYLRAQTGAAVRCRVGTEVVRVRLVAVHDDGYRATYLIVGRGVRARDSIG